MFVGLYYGVTICLVSFASGISVLTLNIHHRGVRGIEVPKMVKKIVLGWLAKIVLLHFEDTLPPEKISKKNVSFYLYFLLCNI